MDALLSDDGLPPFCSLNEFTEFVQKYSDIRPQAQSNAESMRAGGISGVSGAGTERTRRIATSVAASSKIPDDDKEGMLSQLQQKEEVGARRLFVRNLISSMGRLHAGFREKGVKEVTKWMLVKHLAADGLCPPMLDLVHELFAYLDTSNKGLITVSKLNPEVLGGYANMPGGVPKAPPPSEGERGLPVGEPALNLET
jgi:hypothetical protein